jgi:hypothetical protein
VIAIASDLILKTARNLIVKVIDIIKLVISGFLDLLEAPIDIPIISSIYKIISGNQLSILDLICLVGAIPATIIYKLVAGKTPFPDNSHTQALINAPNFATLKSLLSGSTSAPARPKPVSALSLHSKAPAAKSPSGHIMAFAAQAQVTVQAESPAQTALDVMNAMCNILAFPGSLLVANCAFAKGATEGVASASIRGLAAASYLLYVAPDISGAFIDSSKWYVQMNYSLTIISTVKTWTDNFFAPFPLFSPWNDYISPFAESIINFIWLTTAIAPIILNKSPKTSDWCSMGANLAFDLGGVITFLTAKNFPPQVSVVALGIAQNLTVAYGILGIAVGGELANGN